MANNTENTKIEYDFKSIEEKWVRDWYGKNIYKSVIDETRLKYYCLDTWAYPSANGVTVGYVKSFGGMDVIARYHRMKGFNVLYTTGWDTLGLPAENYAIKIGRHPREITRESIEHFRKRFQAFGLSYDWSREVDAADPSYYRWTQWIFLIMFKAGLAYRKKSPVSWCPSCKTVLAQEQVIDGKCERCGTPSTTKRLMQWFFKITEYADRLDRDIAKLNWEKKYLETHRKWIGKKIKNGKTTFHLRDWCVSRQRYWGPPISVVYCKKCGEVPVPEDQLPVVLPHDVDYTPTGEAPLAKDPDFVNTTCPTCGGAAKREVDTLDTFVSSAWYQFRFTDPHNEKVFASQESLDYWKNVDHYQGTIEHFTAHLVYARFVTKVLFDQGHVPFDEPFPKYTPVGVLADKTGEKFSKRLGNAPDTDSLVNKYGGDVLRLTCYFLGPFVDITKWDEATVPGLIRFRDRMWRIFENKIDTNVKNVDKTVDIAANQMVTDVGLAIEQMRFNIAVSKMMVFINTCTKYEGTISQFAWETFTKVLAPFAPFIAEEMWTRMGHSDSVHFQSWPEVV